jgi:hypothetical protein
MIHKLLISIQQNFKSINLIRFIVIYDHFMRFLEILFFILKSVTGDPYTLSIRAKQ